MNKLTVILKLLFCAGKKELFFSILITIVQGLLLSAEVVIWGLLVDGISTALEGMGLKNVFFAMALYVVFAVTSAILTQLYSKLSWSYNTKLNNELVNRIFVKCSEMNFSRFNDSETYDTISRITTESITGLTSLTQSVFGIVQYFIAYMSVVGILIKYNVYIIFIATLAILPIFIANVRLAKRMYETDCEVTESKRMINKLGGYFYSMKTAQELRCYRLTDFFMNKIKHYQAFAYDKENKTRIHRLKVELSINIAYIILNYGMKTWAVILSVNSVFGIGVITMYVNAIEQICTDLQEIVGAVSDLNENRYYITALTGFLNEPSEISDGAAVGDVCEVRFEHVYFRYPQTEWDVLSDVSFKLKKGEAYLLSGENGSGKSTIIKLILGLYKPTQGRIYVNDVDINDIDRQEYYLHIGVMFQEFNRYPFSIRENIALGRNGDDSVITRLLRNYGLSEYVDSLDGGIDEILDNEQYGGVDLSLGQWQRIALCRMMYENRSLVVLDEPTASLDYNMSQKVIRDCTDNCRDRILLIISHEPDFEDVVDFTIKLKNGKISDTREVIS